MYQSHIELDGTSMSPAEAELALKEILATYGQTVRAGFRAGTETLTVTDRHGKEQQLSFAELLTELHVSGASQLHLIRWRDTEPYGTVALALPEGLPPTVIGSGPRNSPPLSGPGYATNDVVTELLDDIMHFRRVVAQHGDQGDMFREAFRGYRCYLTACISAVDSHLNSLSWFSRHEPSVVLAPSDRSLLSNKSLRLNEKLRQWLPIVTGVRLSETSPSWLDFQALRQARNAFVHVNEPDFLFSLRDAAGVLNLCRQGVGGLLLDIAQLLKRYPSPAIRHVAYAPRARYVGSR
jgi:hypothetical protein